MASATEESSKKRLKMDASFLKNELVRFSKQAKENQPEDLDGPSARRNLFGRSEAEWFPNEDGIYKIKKLVENPLSKKENDDIFKFKNGDLLFCYMDSTSQYSNNTFGLGKITTIHCQDTYCEDDMTDAFNEEPFREGQQKFPVHKLIEEIEFIGKNVMDFFFPFGKKPLLDYEQTMQRLSIILSGKNTFSESGELLQCFKELIQNPELFETYSQNVKNKFTRR